MLERKRAVQWKIEERCRGGAGRRRFAAQMPSAQGTANRGGAPIVTYTKLQILFN